MVSSVLMFSLARMKDFFGKRLKEIFDEYLNDSSKLVLSLYYKGANINTRELFCLWIFVTNNFTSNNCLAIEVKSSVCDSEIKNPLYALFAKCTVAIGSAGP